MLCLLLDIYDLHRFMQFVYMHFRLPFILTFSYFIFSDFTYNHLTFCSYRRSANGQQVHFLCMVEKLERHALVQRVEWKLHFLV